MTIEQLLVRLDRQRLRYAFVLADLRAAGEVICNATADQILLAELAGYVVNLRTGQVTHIPGYYPPWLDELTHEPSHEPSIVSPEGATTGNRCRCRTQRTDNSDKQHEGGGMAL